MAWEEGLECGKNNARGRAGSVRPHGGRRGHNHHQPNALGHKIERAGLAAVAVRRWRATVNATMGKTYYYNKLTNEVSQRRQSQRRSG
jgi:hypothetical protein